MKPITREECREMLQTYDALKRTEQAVSEGAPTESTGPAKVVAAVATGSGCGVCAHWKQTTRYNRPPFGICMWRPDKRPAWFSIENSTMLFETDGKRCETFTPNK